jgi:enoyl-CoA hydratase/carnithine racemase
VGEQVVVEEVEQGIACITLQRPARLNALTFAMFGEIEQAIREVDAANDIRAAVLTGAGRGFCAGLDLDDAATLPSMGAVEMLRGQEGWARAITSLCNASTPIVAAVNGPAAGAGLSLALAADIRIASPAARFNAAFVRIGLSGGDCGSSWLLPRIIGMGRASELLLTGRLVDAEEALALGLVNRVVPESDLLEEAVAVARQIAANSPLGVRLTKAVLHANVDAPSLEAAIELENRNQVLAAGTADMAEALSAFRERRAPTFQDR